MPSYEQYKTLAITKCNLCGGKVIFTRNDRIYGKSYGSGFCYLCTQCGAYVGTHKYPKNAPLGILANARMRELKQTCHYFFDQQWKGKKNSGYKRTQAYKQLAEKMGIPEEDCHFGYMDEPTLKRALRIILNRESKNEKNI